KKSSPNNPASGCKLRQRPAGEFPAFLGQRKPSATVRDEPFPDGINDGAPREILLPAEALFEVRDLRFALLLGRPFVVEQVYDEHPPRKVPLLVRLPRVNRNQPPLRGEEEN